MFSPARLRALLPAFLGVAALLLLLGGLSRPDTIVFDETYYVNNAREYLRQGIEDGFAVHPPAGKWMIASGIVLFGDNPVGWRVAGVFAGAAVVALTYLIAESLLRDRGLAALAALLVVTDGLIFVMSRTAMLDIFLAFWVALGIWFLLVDRERSGLEPDAAESDDDLRPIARSRRLPRVLQASSREATAADHEPDGAWRLRPRGHAYRWLAGASFGLATATKWSGLYALAAAGLLSIGWELAHRKRIAGTPFIDLVPAARSIVGALVVLPVVVYALTWVPWLVNFGAGRQAEGRCEAGVACDIPITERLQALVDDHVDIWNFHTGLEFEHRYRAPAYTWLYMGRPVVYYWENCPPERAALQPTFDADGNAEMPEPCVVPEGDAAEIIALGNPVLWWLFLPALLPLASGVGRRDPAALVVAAFWGLQFLPWLVTPRIVFFFYMTPLVPLLALTLAYAIRWLRERPPVGALLTGAGLGAVAGFLAGVAVQAVADADPSLHWVTLGAGLFLGAVVGAHVDRRSGPVARTPSPWRIRQSAALVPILVAAAAVGTFLYLYPVLAAVPLPQDQIEQRWWFDSWI